MSSGQSSRYTVAILQRRLVQYRLGLFERMRAECARRGIDLRVVYGEASAIDRMRNDSGSLPWADEVNARWFTIGGTELVWQHVPRSAKNADLIVMTQENKILSNYLLLLRRAVRRGGRTAYWGHGRNLQSTKPTGMSERWKALLLTKIDWWFAYTQGTVDFLTTAGFPLDQITRLDNAIDDDAFRADLAAVSDETLDRLRTEVDLGPGAPLGIHCGSLYREKKVDELIAVAEHIQAAIPEFRLVIIGDGPDRTRLEALLADRPWGRCVGTKTGIDKAAWFRLASVQLNPGLVGLHVLDSFVSGVPLITTRDAHHSPEIEYLDDGVNGLFVDPDPQRFAEAVTELLSDQDRYQAMVEAGRKAAELYSMSNMVSNFVEGISACLGLDPGSIGED